MTYWPISSPSVFAATKRTDPGRAHNSHDGAEHQQLGEQDADKPSQTHPGDGASAQSKSEVEDKNGASVEDDIHGTIIAIRVTRSGHMFATLTRTTLTVWQTKACPIASVTPQVLTLRSLRLF